MIVVDASVVVKLLVGSEPEQALAERHLADASVLVVPDHMPLEVLRTLRRYELARQLPIAAVEQAKDAFLSLALDRHGATAELLSDAWDIRHNLSIYDAPYVALALRFDAPLVTFDARLGHAAAALGVTALILEC